MLTIDVHSVIFARLGRHPRKTYIDYFKVTATCLHAKDTNNDARDEWCLIKNLANAN